MRTGFSIVALWLLACAAAFGDFVIVQRVEGASEQSGNVTVKVRGGKVRVDMVPQVSQIMDSASGDTLTLLHDKKAYIRLSAERTKALMEQLSRAQADAAARTNAPAPAKPAATGKKEMVGEWQAEVFTWSNGTLSARYWVTREFPNLEAVQKAMDQLNGGNLGAVARELGPSHRDFPGMVVKTEMKLAGKTIVSTLVSVAEQPVEAGEVELPADYIELASPEFHIPAAPPEGREPPAPAGSPEKP